MTSPSVENFFDNSVRSGAPSAKLSKPGDWVKGTIEDQFLVDRLDFATQKPIVDKVTGQNQQQLVIVLQTESRNWDGVVKTPLTDPSDRNSAQRPGSDDDGKRAVYVPAFTNIHAAIGRAVLEATGKKGPVLNGGTLGVKVTNLEDTGKGNPKKVHAAVYTAPTASASFFEDKADEAPSQDPWVSRASSSSERDEEPPF